MRKAVESPSSASLGLSWQGIARAGSDGYGMLSRRAIAALHAFLSSGRAAGITSGPGLRRGPGPRVKGGALELQAYAAVCLFPPQAIRAVNVERAGRPRGGGRRRRFGEAGASTPGSRSGVCTRRFCVSWAAPIDPRMGWFEADGRHGLARPDTMACGLQSRCSTAERSRPPGTSGA